MKAIILAGGFGKRLRPLTLERPKPLVEVAGKPILQWQIEWLKKEGIDEIILSVGHLKEKIFKELGDGKKFGVTIYYSTEDEPLGTGGAIKNAMRFIKEDVFIALNGDIITNIPLSPLIKALDSNTIAAMALVYMRSPYGIVEIDENHNIIAFKEKPLTNYLINAGIYVFKKEIYNYLPDKGDIERDTFPKLAKERKLKGIVFTNSFWKSIDTVKDIEEVNRILSKHA